MCEARLERKVSRYLASVAKAFQRARVQPPKGMEEGVDEVIDAARRYFSDSIHFKNKRDLVTSLATVAYCEGLLDALRMLGFVEFEWE